MGDWEGKQHLTAPAGTLAMQGNIWKNNPWKNNPYSMP